MSTSEEEEAYWRKHVSAGGRKAEGNLVGQLRAMSGVSTHLIHKWMRGERIRKESERAIVRLYAEAVAIQKEKLAELYERAEDARRKIEDRQHELFLQEHLLMDAVNNSDEFYPEALTYGAAIDSYSQKP